MTIRGHMMDGAPASAWPQLAAMTKGAGDPLVLLHGGTGSWTHWTRNIDVFASRFRVHALDLPGFGDSPKVPSGLDTEAYVDWVADAVGRYAERGRPLYLVGFSFGAVLAAGTAARLGSRLTALTLVGPGGFGAPSGRNLDLRSLPPGGSPDEVRAVLRHNLMRMMLADPASLDDETLAIHERNFRRSRFDSRRISLQSRLLDDLRRVKCPLQMIWGALDHLAYPSIEARAALCRDVRPDLRLDVIPSAGHWAQYEQAAAFNEAVMRFLLSAPERSSAQDHESRPSYRSAKE